MNLYIGLLSLIICTFSGYRLSVKYTERKDFFTDFFSFNEKMINEVSFSQNSLLSLAVKEKNSSRDFGKLLFEKITNKNFSSLNYLKTEERDFFNDYVKQLGKSDRESQLVFLSARKKIIEEKRLIVEKEEQKYRKLYIKLGFLFGLIIFVALI